MAGVVIVGDRDTPGDDAGGSIAFARPKSSTFTVPSGRTLIFAGFRSRWMIPCSCAASRASAICFAIGSASSSGIAPRAMRCDKILAFDQFHHQGADAIRFFEPVDVGNVGMVQRREDLRFAREPCEAFRIGGERIGKDLDRDVTIQLRIARAIHLPHSAYADLGRDFVRAEACAGSQGHAIDVIIGSETECGRDYSRSTA